MKIKYVVGLVVVAFLLGVFLPSQCGKGKVAYWKGRSEQSLKDLEKVEKAFKQEKEWDAALQREKDTKIAALEEEIAKETQVIIVKEEAIVVTREMLIASGLYNGLVKELDEKWASKYASLDRILITKDALLEEWQEKFDSKVELEMEGWVERDLAKQEALERVQKLCKVQERALKRSKFWGTVGKGFTAYHAVKGGISLAKGIL